MATPPEDQNRSTLPQPPEVMTPTQEDEQRLDAAESPGGLLGLLLWPLQAALAFGLQLAGGLISGILASLLGRTGTCEEE